MKNTETKIAEKKIAEKKNNQKKNTETKNKEKKNNQNKYTEKQADESEIVRAEKRRERTERRTLRRKYPIWSNCLYTFRALRREEGAGAAAVCAGDSVCSVLLPFLEAALAGAVTACLVNGRAAWVRLLMVAGYVLLLQTMRFCQGNLKTVRSKVLLLFRIDMGGEFFRKTLEMSGQSLESALGRKKWEAAQRNLYMGNETGIEAYARSFWDMLSNLAGLAVYAVVLGAESGILLAILVLQTLLVTGFHLLAARRSYGIEDEIEDIWRRFRYLRRESLIGTNGKDIRMYRMDRWFIRTLRDMTGKIGRLIDREENGYMAAGMGNHMLAFARNVPVYVWLIREMALGNLGLPAFLLYVGLVAGFEPWVRGFLEAVMGILKNEKIIKNYRDFMDFGVVEEGEPVPERRGNAREIRLEHVWFRYDGSDEDTIRDLSLTIRAGEKLALVGRNGAGKTTLIKLLCGLYRPTSGKIYLDGRDMQSLCRRELFREFAVVFQDVFSFSFPLSENVSCVSAGEEDADRLQQCLKQAGLWERVQELPKMAATSMNQDMDEEGVTLSGGELQKLMLARALYKDAPAVILDEPTAALDPIAESEMYEKYNSMIRDKTAVFISHRLSSTRFCDRILFMEQGRIIQEGSHESLMRQGGAYAELFSLQAGYYQKE